MSHPVYTPRELIELHVAAIYTHDQTGRLVAVNQWYGGSAPRFYLGRTRAGNIWRVRHDVPDDLGRELMARGRDEPVVGDLTQPPAYAAEYRRLLDTHAPVEKVWSGPAYYLPAAAQAQKPVVAVTAANADLLRSGLDEWLPDIPHCQPMMVALEDGRAVAICASVRITPQAHVAGVETLPAYRGRGLAVAAVAGWTRAVHALGLVALYSTAWSNLASQAVAAKSGADLFGADFHLT